MSNGITSDGNRIQATAPFDWTTGIAISFSATYGAVLAGTAPTYGMVALGLCQASPTAASDGQTKALLIGARGQLLTMNVDPNGTYIDPTTPVRVYQAAGASAARLVSSAATTNATSVKASPAVFYKATGYNAKASAVYLKIYNKASAPTVGTDVPAWTEYLPASSKFVIDLPAGFVLSAGFAYALTTGSGDADNTAVSSGDILGLNFLYA